MTFGFSHRQGFRSFLLLFALGEKEWNISRNHVMQICFPQASNACPGGNEAEKERRSVAKSASTTGGPAPLDFAIVLGCVFLSPVCGVFLRCLTYRKRTQLNTALSQCFFFIFMFVLRLPPPSILFLWEGCKEADAFWIVEY